MICPNVIRKCERIPFSSKDGAFSFADEVPGVFTNAKQPKDLLKSHRLRRATERKWKHAYVRIAG